MPKKTWNIEQNEAIQMLIKHALGKIRSEYVLIDGWTYHNLTHTVDVLTASWQISTRLPEEERLLLLLAAAYHDVIQNKDSSEVLSANYCLEQMESMRIFSEVQKETVYRAIMSTIINPNNQTVLRRNPISELGMLLSDADFSLLGRNWEFFIDRTKRLYLEFSLKGLLENTPSDWKDFLQRQVALLANFSYFSNEASLAFPNTRLLLSYLEIMIGDKW